MVPASPTAQPLVASTSSMPASVAVVFVTAGAQSAPPLRVDKIVPPVPAVHATSGSTALTAYSRASVGAGCARQLAPASVVLAIAPNAPTAQPVLALAKLTPNSTLVV